VFVATGVKVRLADSVSTLPRAHKRPFEMYQQTPRAIRHLTFDEAVQVWLRFWNGEYQDRIAAFFDVNPGRVNEVVKLRLWG
jgi:hypothetical protein